MRMRLKRHTAAFNSNLQANAGHLLGLGTLSGENKVNVHKRPFLKSSKKNHFKSLAPGLARQAVIAVSYEQVKGGGSEDQDTYVTSTTTLRLIQWLSLI